MLLASTSIAGSSSLLVFTSTMLDRILGLSLDIISTMLDKTVGSAWIWTWLEIIWLFSSLTSTFANGFWFFLILIGGLSLTSTLLERIVGPSKKIQVWVGVRLGEVWEGKGLGMLTCFDFYHAWRFHIPFNNFYNAENGFGLFWFFHRGFLLGFNRFAWFDFRFRLLGWLCLDYCWLFCWLFGFLFRGCKEINKGRELMRLSKNYWRWSKTSAAETSED